MILLIYVYEWKNRNRHEFEVNMPSISCDRDLFINCYEKNEIFVIYWKL